MGKEHVRLPSVKLSSLGQNFDLGRLGLADKRSDKRHSEVTVFVLCFVFYQFFVFSILYGEKIQKVEKNFCKMNI